MDDKDINQDGKVTEEEFAIYKRKMQAQRYMATAALASSILFLAILLTSFVDESRVGALSDIFSMFFFTMGGVVAAYFGISAWMSKN